MFSNSIESLLDKRDSALGAFNTVLVKLQETNKKLSEFITQKKSDNSNLSATIAENENHINQAEEAILQSNKTIKNIEAILA